MEEQFKISIVVAIYNSEKFLAKLLKSIIGQTYSNFEAILVDDGSLDDSGEICDEFALQDSRISVIHKKNGGACNARNRGIEKATGNYMVIIDGDDWLEPDYLEYLLSIAINTKSDMAMSDKIFTTRDRSQTKEDKIEVLTAEDATAMILYPHMDIGPWNKIYSLDMIKKYNLSFSTKWSGEGLYFASMAAQYSNHVGLGHRKVYNYRLNNHGSGLTNYKLEIATNALENIRYIGDQLVLKTPRLKQAVNWHIFKNNYFVIYLIVATNAFKANQVLYKECHKYMFNHLFHDICKSEISFYEKKKMIIETLFPITYAKRSIKIASIALANDHME